MRFFAVYKIPIDFSPMTLFLAIQKMESSWFRKSVSGRMKHAVVLMTDADLQCDKCVILHIPKTLICLRKKTWTPLSGSDNRLQQPGTGTSKKIKNFR